MFQTRLLFLIVFATMRANTFSFLRPGLPFGVAFRRGAGAAARARAQAVWL